MAIFYETVVMIYAVNFCHFFHASDATQNRPCEPVTWTQIARSYDLTLDPVTKNLVIFRKNQVCISPHFENILRVIKIAVGCSDSNWRGRMANPKTASCIENMKNTAISHQNLPKYATMVTGVVDAVIKTSGWPFH